VDRDIGGLCRRHPRTGPEDHAADNRTSDRASYDAQALIDLINESDGDLTGTGYSQADLDDLLAETSAQIAIEEDAVPPAPATPATRIGDIVDLGPHRLACGDAQDDDLLERLVDGDSPARCLITDPPWGVEYEGKTPRRLRLKNDQPDGLEELLDGAFGSMDRRLALGAAVYVFHPPGNRALTFLTAFVAAGWELRQSLVWSKDAMVLGHADYHYRHEQILYGFKPAPARLGRGGAGWYGDHRQTSVIHAARPRAAREHPTTKPPELLANLLRNSTRRDDLVLDPFAGSGSTLIACDHLGRRARLVEVDPRYCDVIIARYRARQTRKEL
jgi:DNA modification methylase